MHMLTNFIYELHIGHWDCNKRTLLHCNQVVLHSNHLIYGNAVMKTYGYQLHNNNN